MAGLHHSRMAQGKLCRVIDGCKSVRSGMTKSCTQRIDLPSEQMNLLRAINNDRLLSGEKRMTIVQFKQFAQFMF